MRNLRNGWRELSAPRVTWIVVAGRRSDYDCGYETICRSSSRPKAI
jgi:hypothetical protein